MEWLNYHHLLYFWLAVKEGGVTGAARRLRLAHPTVSGQIRELEEALGEKLFVRRGRRVEPTGMGRLVFRYADEIFALGRELQDAVKDRPTGRPLRLQVGVADVMPKLVVHRLLAPALALAEPVRLSCREDKPERLLAGLAAHELDVVLADMPLASGSPVRAFSHLLGECGVTFFATAALARAHRGAFPRSLDGAPMLLPSEGTALRRSLEPWFEREHVRPHVVGEFDDSALMKAFGAEGAGFFPAPSIVEDEVVSQFGVRTVGRAPNVRERFYAISIERRLAHPAVVAISDTARRSTFR